ncbi:MAG: 30S ribosomal protein S21, partial [Sedimentisphaerales bacterium]|nr:30S ribosomal protein S21 [Sedimentisphaerales bacterium]
RTADKPERLGWQKGNFCMLKVKSRTGESVQQMMRRFKKLCEKEGLIRDMKRTAYYEKPSERNRRRLRKSQRVIFNFPTR